MRGFVYLIVFFSFFDLFSQLPVMSPFALFTWRNAIFNWTCSRYVFIFKYDRKHHFWFYDR